MANSNQPSKVSGYGSAAVAGAEAFSVVGGMVSDHISSQAQKYYQRAIAESNAKIAAYKIKDASDRGDLAASQNTKKVSQLLGSQKVALATQGIDITEGSAHNALVDTQTEGVLDAITIRNNAAREAFGFKIEQFNNSAASELSGFAADARDRQSLLTGGYNLLGTSTRAATRFQSIYSKGPTNGTAERNDEEN